MIIHNLGIKDYTEVWEKMKEFTEARDSHSCDEL
ncbi:TPA: octanoyltransferase, partial [Legionella pneumophila]